MDESLFATNPWAVEDASVFLKFCCPECDFQIPDLQMFSDHAVDNHIRSTVLFGRKENPEKMVIKKKN